MSRDINFLLYKYQTKQPGEIWTTEMETEAKREYRFKQRIFLFDQLNEGFLKGTEVDRVEYLIEHFDFNIMGSVTDEETIRMMMLYVKLETGKHDIGKYEYYLEKHNISKNRFITFLIKIAKYSIDKSYI